MLKLNRITLTPEMAKKLGLDLKQGDDVAIMLKGKVEEVGNNVTVGVEDVRGRMIDSAMLTEDGDKDNSLMARAFRLAARKNESGDDTGGETSAGQTDRREGAEREGEDEKS